MHEFYSVGKPPNQGGDVTVKNEKRQNTILKSNWKTEHAKGRNWAQQRRPRKPSQEI